MPKIRTLTVRHVPGAPTIVGTSVLFTDDDGAETILPVGKVTLVDDVKGWRTAIIEVHETAAFHIRTVEPNTEAPVIPAAEAQAGRGEPDSGADGGASPERTHRSDAR